MEEKNSTFVGHSKRFSLDEALEDAAQQARATLPQEAVEFTVTSVRGRIGGKGAVRDLWVEIRASRPEDPEQDTEEKYTTMAVGEEGGEDDPMSDPGADRGIGAPR